MTNEQAIAILENHQKWRLGCDETPPTDPKQLTEAMKVGIDFMKKAKASAHIKGS